MKLNQRYDISQQQKLKKSRIYQKYRNHIENLIENDQQLSFNSIQTPGWTSLVGTQQSKQINKIYHKKQQNCIKQKQQFNSQQSILKRLNSLPKLNQQQQVYNNIRLHSNSLNKNKNIIIYQSAKLSQNKQNETPKTNTNKFLNRFSSKSSKQNKNLSQLRSIQKNNEKFNSSAKRSNTCSKAKLSSVRSQPGTNLKDLINQRLSMRNNYNSSNHIKNNQNWLYIPSSFDSKLNTQTNQQPEILNKTQQLGFNKKVLVPKFYNSIHNPSNKNSNADKNQYLNRYLNKLNQRTQSSSNFRNKSVQNKKPIQIDNKLNKINLPQNKVQNNARFKAISVHDHLYNGSKKLQAKKNMMRMIDESYKKSTILTFTPRISQKSNALAESKFLRQSKYINQQNINKQNCNNFNPQQKHTFHQNCGTKNINLRNSKDKSNLKNSKIYSMKQQINMKQKEKMKVKLQNRILIKLFNILSCDTQQINQKTLQQNIQKLPLSLIQLLQQFLTKVYQKNVYKINEFLQIFSQDKQNKNRIKGILCKKSAIMTQTQKYLKSLNKNLIDKQNINNTNQGLQAYFQQKIKLNI